jgi:hypothetical protein
MVGGVLSSIGNAARLPRLTGSVAQRDINARLGPKQAGVSNVFAQKDLPQPEPARQSVAHGIPPTLAASCKSFRAA